MAYRNRLRPNSGADAAAAPAAPAPGQQTGQYEPRLRGVGELFSGASPVAYVRELRRMQEKAKEQQARDRARETAVTASLDEDLLRLSQEQPETVESWRNIANYVIRLANSDDDEAQAQAKTLIQNYPDQLKPHVDVIDAGFWEENYEKPDEPGLWDRAKGLFGTAMDVIDRPSQGALSAIAELHKGGGGLDDAASALARGLTFQDQPASRVERLDMDDDGRLNYREAFRRDPDSGEVFGLRGRWAGLFDTIGVIATDPLTWITLGGSNVAKSGLKAITRQSAREGATATGARIAQTIRQRGWNALDSADREIARGWINTEARQAVARYAATSTDDALRTRAARALRRSDESIAKAAERRAARVERGVRRGGRSGVRVAGRTVLPTGQLSRLSQAGRLTARPTFGTRTESILGDVPVERGAAPLPPVTRPGVVGTRTVETMRVRNGMTTLMKNWAPLRRIRGAFVPRARVSDAADLGRPVAEALDETSAAARASFDNAVNDLSLRLVPLGRRAAREHGGDEELMRFLNRALSTEEALDEARAAVTAAGRGQRHTLRLLDALEEVRFETYQAALKAGADPTRLREVANYIPRVITGQARRRIERALATDDGTLREALGDIGLLDETGRLGQTDLFGQRGALRRRTLIPDTQDIFKVNAAARHALRRAGIENVDELYESNLIRAYAVRSRSAMEAHTTMAVLDGMTEITDGLGRQVAYIARDKSGLADTVARMKADGAVLSAFHREVLPNSGSAWVRREVWDEMTEVRRVLSNPRELRRVQNFVNRWNGIWAAYATVPLVGGLGFHARNMTGNIFNSILAGMRNPTHWANAMKLQRENSKVRALMRREGIGWEAAARRTLTSEQYNLLAGARETGVLGTGLVDDIFDEGGIIFDERRGRLVDPLSQQNVILRSGRKVGQTIEDNARLGLYMDGLDQGMSPAAAAARVRKHLFDYNDLTRFESDVLRTVSRFYTWVRKNTALQATVLAQYPGRVINAQRITDEFADFVAGEGRDIEEPTVGGLLIPQWAGPAGFQMRGGNLVGVETPLLSAAETIENLASAAAIIPGLENTPLGQIAPEDSEDRAGRVLQLFAGGPVSAIDLLYENRYQRDLFSGKPLENTNGDNWLRIISTVFPVVEKIAREGDKWVSEDGETGPPLRLMNALFGLQTYDLSDDQQGRAAMGALMELERSIDAMRERGVEVPTIDELREAAVIDRQNIVLETMYYSDRVDDALLELLPKEYRDALGIAEPGTDEAESQDLNELRWDAEQVLEADRVWRERMGLPPINTMERQRLLLSLPGMANNTQLEALGIEPFRPNRFLPATQSEQEELRVVKRKLDLAGEVYGLGATDLTRLRPLLTNAESIVRDGRAIGMSERSISIELVDQLSRQERGHIFGADTLDKYYKKELTDEEIEKIRNRSWERRSELRLVFQLTVGRNPTKAEEDTYVYWNELTKGDQELLGLPKSPTIPNRKDVRTDAEKLADAQREYEALSDPAALREYVPATGDPVIAPSDRGESLPPQLVESGVSGFRNRLTR